MKILKDSTTIGPKKSNVPFPVTRSQHMNVPCEVDAGVLRLTATGGMGNLAVAS
jgi:hypothetical protein